MAARVGLGLAFTLTVAIAYVEKARIQSWIPRVTAHEPIAWVASTLGRGATIGWLAVTMLGLGLLLRRRAWIDTALALGAGGAACFALTKIGQFVLAEDRPRSGGAMHFCQHGGHGISGHVAASALLFFPLTLLLCASWSRRAREGASIAIASWIVVVSWARMALGMHHAWNVLLGAALGLWIGHVVVRLVRSLRPAPTTLT